MALFLGKLKTFAVALVYALFRFAAKNKDKNFQFKGKLSFISSSLAFNAISCGSTRLNFCHA